MTAIAAPVPVPPSRRDNPFATCWTRPGALAFRFAEGLSGEQLVARLAAQRWWGAIVGPHGSGKSTLLKTLAPLLHAAGGQLYTFSARNGFTPDCGEPRRVDPGIRATRRIRPADVARQAASFGGPMGSQLPRASTRGDRPRALVLVDGYEQLGWLTRAWLKHRCRRANAGLLVTAHAPTRIPSLVRLAPDARLVQRLVAELCAELATPVTPADVDASHACHGSNVREIFFDLYDRHERLRRMLPQRNVLTGV